MPKTGDFLCHLCGEFIADRANPFSVQLWLEQPEDRVGTPYDLAQVPPFLAMLSVMHLPRFEACGECCFVGTLDDDGARTRPPIFTVDLTNPALRAYLTQHGARVDVPGLPVQHSAAPSQHALSPESL